MDHTLRIVPQLHRTTREEFPAFLLRAFKLSGPVEVSLRFPILLFWINRFLTQEMSSDYLDLSLMLASGVKVALAQVLLSHLYRGLFHFVDSHFASFGGPVLVF